MITYTNSKEELDIQIQENLKELNSLTSLYSTKHQIISTCLQNTNEEIQKNMKKEEIDHFMELLSKSRISLDYLRKQLSILKKSVEMLENIQSSDIDEDKDQYNSSIDTFNDLYKTFKTNLCEHSDNDENLILEYINNSVLQAFIPKVNNQETIELPCDNSNINVNCGTSLNVDESIKSGKSMNIINYIPYDSVSNNLTSADVLSGQKKLNSLSESEQLNILSGAQQLNSLSESGQLNILSGAEQLNSLSDAEQQNPLSEPEKLKTAIAHLVNDEDTQVNSFDDEVIDIPRFKLGKSIAPKGKNKAKGMGKMKAKADKNIDIDAKHSIQPKSKAKNKVADKGKNTAKAKVKNTDVAKNKAKSIAKVKDMDTVKNKTKDATVLTDMDTDSVFVNVEYPINTTEDNKTLLISEVQDRVVLPYTLSDLKKALKKNPNYNSIEDVVRDKYIFPLSNFKNSSKARFKEGYSLMRKKERASVFDSLDLAFEVTFNSSLNPAVIAACRNLNELDTYLDCLDADQLDQFNCFDIKYEMLPSKIYK